MEIQPVGSGLEWAQEIEWGIRYIHPYTQNNSAEELAEIMVKGIEKRRGWLREADEVIERFYIRHPNLRYGILQKPKITSDKNYHNEAYQLATQFLPLWICTYGIAIKDKELMEATIPFFVLSAMTENEN